LMRIAGREITEEKQRKDIRERVRKHRAAKKKAPKVSVTSTPVTEVEASTSSPPRPEPARATGSADTELTEEQHRERMASLDTGPANEIVDEVSKRVSCVANTIRRHVDGLAYSDGARFFAALRDQIDDIEREAFRGGGDEVAS